MTGMLDRIIRRLESERQSAPNRQENELSDEISGNAEPQSGQPVGHTTTIHKRQHHHVSKLSDRLKVVKWMVQAHEQYEKNLSKRTIEKFPQCFAGSSSAKYMKAKRWWEEREKILKTDDGNKQLGMRVKTGPKKNGGTAVLLMKELSGRGRKSSVWVVELHKELLSEFERLRAAGMKMNTKILKSIALELIEEAPNNSPFNSTIVIDGLSIRDKITLRWVQRFMSNNCIVCRVLCGKNNLSDAKILLIEKEGAYHLGQLKKGFESGELEEDCIENADENHLVLSMDNGHTLGLKGEESVKYSDFVSGGDPITMIVRLTGGKNASIQPCMLIFKNGNRSYPISGVTDKVPGVCYRSSPKGYMDRETWIEWLFEPRAFPRLPYGKTRTRFVDNCSSHSGVESGDSILQRSMTNIRKLVKNATEKFQAADSFVIQKLKDAWRRLWDQYRLKAIKEGLLMIETTIKQVAA